MLKIIKRKKSLRSRIRKFWDLKRTTGVIPAFLLRFKKKLFSSYTIRPLFVSHPLIVRNDSSDFQVFSQIFIRDEYSCLGTKLKDGLIIDAGANVGYSSVYFLNKFPQNNVIAIEPDPDNFAMLQRNVAKYGDRIEVINAGVWSHPAELMLEEDQYRDGDAWSKQVRECKPGELPEMKGIDIKSILSASRFERISLLKMDIEGAEAVVFAATDLQWLDNVDAIAIELHDDSNFGNGTEIFFSAIKDRGYQISRSEELTICIRP